MSFRSSSIPVFAFGLLLTICSFLSCSVREDRDSCPCVLILELTSSGGGGVANVFSESGFRHSEELDSLAEGTRLRIPVPREPLSVEVVSPPGSVTEEGDVLASEDGMFPEVYTFFDSVKAEGESVSDTVHLRKNYCRLSIRVVSSSGEDYPFSIALNGAVVGYSASGGLLEGNFRREMTPSAEGWCDAVVPRQKDSSLMLDILSEGSALRSFAIGEYLAESGYDWESPSLEDAEIEIDCSATGAVISIDLWSRRVSFEISV